MKDEGFWIGHAFLWQNGPMRDLGTVGGKESEAVAINERGQVVGHSDTAVLGDGFVHLNGFLWEAGTMRDLGLRFRPAIPPNDFWVRGWPSNAINDRGRIIGDVRSGGRAAIWENGSIHVLPTLGKGSRAFDINRAQCGCRVVRGGAAQIWPIPACGGTAGYVTSAFPSATAARQ